MKNSNDWGLSTELCTRYALLGNETETTGEIQIMITRSPIDDFFGRGDRRDYLIIARGEGVQSMYVVLCYLVIDEFITAHCCAIIICPLWSLFLSLPRARGHFPNASVAKYIYRNSKYTTKLIDFIISFTRPHIAKDESVRKMMREIEHLSEDNVKIQKIIDIMNSIRLVESGQGKCKKCIYCPFPI